MSLKNRETAELILKISEKYHFLQVRLGERVLSGSVMNPEDICMSAEL